MGIEITNDELLTKQTSAPHVVILGAGASLAACPTGDRWGRRLPLMKDIVETIGLRDELRDVHPELHGDFEALYSRLHADDPAASILQKIEQHIGDYFGSLELPEYPTIYDLLLLSLRPKDAVFTFNWDPFLFDAYERLVEQFPLPSIHHLHGNVRMGYCDDCATSGAIGHRCEECNRELSPTRLLFPVGEKDYAQDTFIESQWNLVDEKLSEAWYVTIFGYSAPTTDQEAMRRFSTAWKSDGERKHMERLEIIDVRDSDELSRQWSGFAHFFHYDIRRSFYESILAKYPRRTCEALYYMGVEAEFVEIIPWSGNFIGLRDCVARLAAYEQHA